MTFASEDSVHQRYASEDDKFSKVCICEYDGTNYCGWQTQVGLPTVQGCLEESLSGFYQTPIKILGSGRTDAGVHALGQVFHYTTNIDRSNYSLVYALNRILPKDIAMLSVEDAPQRFHPIRSAMNKTYLYKILNQPIRPAMDFYRVWQHREPINCHSLSDILQVVVGEHDFTSFCSAKSIPPNPVRKVNFVNVTNEGNLISIRINADGFLHNMVRILVGTSVKFHLDNPSNAVENMRQMLQGKKRLHCCVAAPAQGLYLEKVFY